MNARLEVNDGLGQRIVPITKDKLSIGLRNEGSRYGTYVNGEAVTEYKLAHGDRVQFGRASGADVVFLTGEGPAHTDRSHASAVNDLRQLASLLESLRALGSGRVLAEVLALALD